MKVFYENTNGALTFKLTGDIDDAGIHKVRGRIDELLDSERYFEVVFDFKGVPFMDSTGIGMLLGRYRKLQKHGVPMYILGVNAQVDKVFYTSGIYEIIKKLA